METIDSEASPIFLQTFLVFLWGMETAGWTSHEERLRWFLVFLWGMETRRSWHYSPYRPQFLVFLWGMETLRWRCATPKHFYVFSLPMRDGNKRNILGFKLWGMVFSLPMRDGNRSRSLAPAISSSVFSLPMRDGNCKWGAERTPTFGGF